jgi:hypothetical protein
VKSGDIFLSIETRKLVHNGAQFISKRSKR